MQRPASSAPINPRRIALIAGISYLLTVVTSIPALALKDPLLNDPALLSDPAGQTMMHWAVLLEIALAITCIATAVALFPIIRHGSEIAALGFVTARVIEAAIIAVAVIAMMSLTVISPSEATGSAGAMLRAIHDWAFLVGPGLIPAVNGFLLGYVLYRTRLVPRILPAIGLIGATLLTVSAVGSIFGVVDQVSILAATAAVPIAVWEIGLGIWLIVKGFNHEALTRLLPQATAAPTR